MAYASRRPGPLTELQILKRHSEIAFPCEAALHDVRRSREDHHMSEEPKDQPLTDEDLEAVVGGAVEGDPTQRSGGSEVSGHENTTGQTNGGSVT